MLYLKVMMTYKQKPKLKLIKAPIILVVGGEESYYKSGVEVANLTFEKNYVVDSISSREDKVVVTLKENERQFSINWIGEEEVSFI